jgi:hypothetical protein
MSPQGLEVRYLRDARGIIGIKLSAKAVAHIEAAKFEVEALLFRLTSSLKEYTRPLLGSNTSECQQSPIQLDIEHSSSLPSSQSILERHSHERFEQFDVYTDTEPFYSTQLTAQKLNQLTGTPELVTQNNALHVRTALINSLR